MQSVTVAFFLMAGGDSRRFDNLLMYVRGHFKKSALWMWLIARPSAARTKREASHASVTTGRPLQPRDRFNGPVPSTSTTSGANISGNNARKQLHTLPGYHAKSVGLGLCRGCGSRRHHTAAEQTVARVVRCICFIRKPCFCIVSMICSPTLAKLQRSACMRPAHGRACNAVCCTERVVCWPRHCIMREQMKTIR